MTTFTTVFSAVGFCMTVAIAMILGVELIWLIQRKIKERRELNKRFRAECVCRDCYNFDETQGQCRLLILNRAEKIKQGLIYNPNVFFCKFGKKKRSE